MLLKMSLKKSLAGARAKQCAQSPPQHTFTHIAKTASQFKLVYGFMVLRLVLQFFIILCRLFGD